MKHSLSVKGVGNGSQQTTRQVELPIALPGGETGVFTTPALENSDLPALWGLNSLEKLKALVDVGSRRLIVPGPGGFKITLSPGSKSYPLEKSPTGHLLLPCCEWAKAQGSGKLSL
jgi:hypothetical protein